MSDIFTDDEHAPHPPQFRDGRRLIYRRPILLTPFGKWLAARGWIVEPEEPHRVVPCAICGEPIHTNIMDAAVAHLNCQQREHRERLERESEEEKRENMKAIIKEAIRELRGEEPSLLTPQQTRMREELIESGRKVISGEAPL